MWLLYIYSASVIKLYKKKNSIQNIKSVKKKKTGQNSIGIQM